MVATKIISRNLYWHNVQKKMHKLLILLFSRTCEIYTKIFFNNKALLVLEIRQY